MAEKNCFLLYGDTRFPLPSHASTFSTKALRSNRLVFLQLSIIFSTQVVQVGAGLGIVVEPVTNKKHPPRRANASNDRCLPIKVLFESSPLTDIALLHRCQSDVPWEQIVTPTLYAQCAPIAISAHSSHFGSNLDPVLQYYQWVAHAN